MKLHLHSLATRQRFGSRSLPVRLGAVALTVLFTASQIPAQGPIPFDTDTAQPAPSTQSSTVTAQAPAVATDLSAPVPNVEQATLAKTSSDSLFAIADAQDPAPGPSSNSLMSTPTVKKKAPHHALGLTLAITGTTVLVASAFFFGLQNHFCSGSSNATCNTVRTNSLIGIGIGAPVAAVGYYFQFHK